MKNSKKWVLVVPFILSACTAQQMRKLEQSMSCQTASMKPAYETGNRCGVPYALTSFVRSVSYGKETKMADGAPAPLLRLVMSPAPGGEIPVLYYNRIWMDLKGGTSGDRRVLYCATGDKKPPTSGDTITYLCEFEDGEIRKGEYLVSELSITTDRCDEPTRYKRAYDTGKEMLCADYQAPEGYPLILFANSGLFSPIDQRKIESVWIE
jgi:hypothetical protein